MKIFKLFFLKKKINSKYLLFKNKYIKHDIIFNKIKFYKIIIIFNLFKKCLFLKKKILKTINICGTGGDYKNLPNISTFNCLIFSLLKNFFKKNSGFSIFLRNGSLDFLKKIKFFDHFLNLKKINFIKFKKKIKINLKFRKKIKKNNFFNIINPIILYFLNKNNIIGIFNSKILFFLKILNFNKNLLFNNNSDDLIQENNFYLFKKKIFSINILQYNFHTLFFKKNIFSENFKFNLFILKNKKNSFLLDKIFTIDLIFKNKNVKKIFYYLFLNNYFYLSLKKKIKKNE